MKDYIRMCATEAKVKLSIYLKTGETWAWQQAADRLKAIGYKVTGPEDAEFYAEQLERLLA